VFQSNRDGGQPEIYAMNPDGTDQRRLTNTPAAKYEHAVAIAAGGRPRRPASARAGTGYSAAGATTGSSAAPARTGFTAVPGATGSWAGPEATGCWPATARATS
jgi:hypothetical protein